MAASVKPTMALNSNATDQPLVESACAATPSTATDTSSVVSSPVDATVKRLLDYRISGGCLWRGVPPTLHTIKCLGEFRIVETDTKTGFPHG